MPKNGPKAVRLVARYHTTTRPCPRPRRRPGPGNQPPTWAEMRPGQSCPLRRIQRPALFSIDQNWCLTPQNPKPLSFLSFPITLLCRKEGIKWWVTGGRPTVSLWAPSPAHAPSDGWTRRHWVAPQWGPSITVNPQSASPSVRWRPLHPAQRRHLTTGSGTAFYPHSAPSSSGAMVGHVPQWWPRACIIKWRLEFFPLDAQICGRRWWTRWKTGKCSTSYPFLFSLLSESTPFTFFPTRSTL
jgi:hypothetical protein